MGGSRRKHKKSRTKVRVGLPRKHPHVFKPAFSVPPKLRSLLHQDHPSSSPKWDDQASVIQNYKSFGFVSNPNLLGVRARTSHIVVADSLQLPPPPPTSGDDDRDSLDFGSDLEEDDLKSALGKRRRDGKSGMPQPLTTLQRVHIGRLIEKHGDDYKGMFMDTKLNSLQHTVATLEKLCTRYHLHGNNNPMILTR